MGKMRERQVKRKMKENKQSNMSNHSEKQFQSIVKHGLVEGGIHVNASKNHGKTRLLFSMSQSLRNLDTCRVLIFDGSEAWLYGFSRIPTFSIGERDIQLINDVATTEDIERYQLTNWNLVKLALSTEKDLLFRLKTRKPSKRGFFIRTVINYMDTLQRAQRETTANHEPKQRIAYFIEEAQDAFNSRSTTRLESEEFLTTFNEARNNFESFYTASQRLTDFSKTIRTKQLYCIGKINEEDKVSGLRRLEKLHNIDFSKLPQRTWFFEGSTFISPEWKQCGKPYQINRELRAKFMANLKPQPQKKKSVIERALNSLDILLNGVHVSQPKATATISNNESEESELDTFDREQEESDLREIEEEFPEDW
jgi:hypothetical protein